MEIFLNIAIPFLLICIVIVFLRSPLEIMRNLFKGLGSMLLGPLAPIFRMAVNAVKEDRLHKKEKKIMSIMAKVENNPRLLHISPLDFDCYIIINGVFSESQINKDFGDAISHFEELRSTDYLYRTNEGVTLLKLASIDTLYHLAYLNQCFSAHYGTENTFGYMEALNLSLFYYENPENNNEIIGQTSQRETFVFSCETQTVEQNFVELGFYSIRSKLNTDFFKQLISSH